MKIIKEGIKDRKNSMRIECFCCMAELEITANDVIKGDRRIYITECPCCEAKILINEGTIPRNMLNKIDYRET